MKEKIGKIIDLTLEIGWLLIIFFVPIYFNPYHSYSIFALREIVLFRVLTEILIILFLIKILFYSIKINFPLKKLFPFLLFFLISILATLFSPYLYQSFWGSFFRHFGLFSALHYFAFFLILIFCLKEEKQVKRIILAILFSTFLICIYGIAQIFGLDTIKWVDSFDKTMRVSSTFGQPNFLGAFLVLVFPLTIFSFNFLKKFWQRIFLFTLCSLEIFILFFTLSRSAYLGLLASLMLLFFIYFYFYSFLPKKRKIIITISLILILASSFSFLLYLKHIDLNYFKSPILYRFTSILDFKTPTFKVRTIYWQAAFKIIKEKPILGYGLDTQIFPYLKYYSPEATVYEAINSHPDRAHNEILDTLITTGFLGLLSYLFLIGFVFYQGFKKKSLFSLFLISALFGYLINNQFSFAVIPTALYFWLYIALIIFKSNEGGRERELKLNFSLVSKILILLFFIATAAILIIYKNINLIKADYYYYTSRVDFNKKDIIKLIDDYNLIIQYNPYEAYYYRQEIEDVLALTEKFNNQALKKDFFDMVLEDIKNISNDKEIFEFLLLKTQLLNAYGKLDKDKFTDAENIYDRLSRLSPQMAVIYNDWGGMYILKKDYQKAIEKFDKALALYPINHPDIDRYNRKEQIKNEMSIVYYNMGDAYFFQKNYDEAIKNYQIALRLQPFIPPLYKNLADSYYLKGNLDQAIKESLNGLRLDSQNKEWYENLSLLYKEKGDLKKVKEYQDKISKL